jgi:hypothetical protein
MGYSFYAVLNALPQIAAVSLVPIASIIAVSALLKMLRRRSAGKPVGLD